MSDYLDINNEELLKDFFTEAEQQVENLESNILVIENDPTNHEAIDEIFRAAHTLKGGSATVEMTELSTFTHAVEDVLDEIRSDRVQVTEPVVDVLLSSIDTIKAMLESRANGSVYQDDVTPLLERLRAFIPEKADKKAKKSAPVQAAPAPAPAPVQAAPQAPAQSGGEVPVLSDDEYAELSQVCEEGQKLWCVTVAFDESNPMNSVGGIQVFAALKACGSVLKTVPDFDALYEDEFYPIVKYYLASNSSSEDIEDVAFLSDVTLSTDAQVVEPESAVKSKPAVSPVQSAPVQAAPVQSAPEPVEAVVQKEEVQAPAASETEVKPQETKKTEAKAPAKGAPATGTHIQQGSVLRVDSKRIDYLLNLVSETVITKAAFNQTASQMSDIQVQFQAIDAAYREKIRRMFDQLPQYLEEIQTGVSIKEIKTNITQEFGDVVNYFDTFESQLKNLSVKFRSSTQNLGRIAGELQEGVMKIRMVPINQIFSRFPRVVRDLQRDLNKKVNLVIEGEDTELDKTVIDDLLDPVMHCVRNSVDHGIETPEVRVAAGKPEEGTLLLKASNEGNQIIIDIADDGAGINVEKVKQKAISKGLIHPNKIISDQEAYQLIFMPGFSTADKISNVSGRGVGLDVVKTMIEKLNGTVSVTSEAGKGTKFSIRLPLTLAIIQGLLVRVGKEVYSIPIASVIESQRVKTEDISTIDNYEVLNVRNEVISILRLSRLFNIKETTQSDYSFVVIVGSEEKKIGVMVDSLIGEEDVVIKPLRDQFTNSPGIAGASVLGDGSVSLIIDVRQLLELGVRQELNAQAAQGSV
ncbi:MAG: chemotaxis protein CheA [Treponema sp.]|uniref:chemotaxis protein CheA n=1 Tax=Treponema sp. TaxID=166 RepID=UPI001D718C7C|nr:chemotaxis protein CheA [Treponema sp.]MBS7311423.1 chemotaxis protein CheA [Treponema sp.]MDD5812589.1 chemotaxis protein CheA [Treponema sp.]MDY5885298.1 chemotaxis protein CheA [Treponema sp.]